MIAVVHVSSAPLNKEIEVNGVRLQYVEDGTGEPVVFVHGALSDNRAWEPDRNEIAKKYHLIAYTQRYFGTSAWKDDGKEFGVATHADDLAKFISSFNVGPVHLVGGHMAARWRWPLP
jgi:pimeloyl-ACP methyl ester carboxylesterase